MAEQTIYLKINLAYNICEVINVLYKIQIRYINHKEFAQGVATNPIFIMLVQVFKVIEAHGIFEVAAPFLNLPYQFWNIGFQINQQIRGLHEVNH